MEKKLQNAVSICLVTDIWSNNASKDFIGLAAAIVDECFDREVFTVDIMRLEQAHTADYIKSCIEKMINRFEFDKALLHGIMCDQGSNMTKAFDQQILTFDNEHDIDITDLEVLIEKQENVTVDFDIEETGNCFFLYSNIKCNNIFNFKCLKKDREVKSISKEINALTISVDKDKADQLEQEFVNNGPGLVNTFIENSFDGTIIFMFT